MTSKRFSESDFVLLHIASNLPGLNQLKTLWKPPSQLSVHFIIVSSKCFRSLDTRLLRDMFDLLFTYRLDSDFWAPYDTSKEFSYEDFKNKIFQLAKIKRFGGL